MKEPLALGAGGFFANAPLLLTGFMALTMLADGQSRFNSTQCSLELLGGAVPSLANTTRRAVHDARLHSIGVRSCPHPWESGIAPRPRRLSDGTVALAKAGAFILRYSFVFFLLFFGALKWTAGEANGIQADGES